MIFAGVEIAAKVRIGDAAFEAGVDDADAVESFDADERSAGEIGAGKFASGRLLAKTSLERLRSRFFHVGRILPDRRLKMKEDVLLLMLFLLLLMLLLL